MAAWFCCVGYLVLLLIAYKALDWLVRRLYLGNYSERYIFITGCDTGFGNLAARRLDALGCHVFAGCLTEAGETELSKSCSSRMQPVSLDVSKPDSVRRAFHVVKDKLPPGKGLWGILNNAGISTRNGPPEWITIDDYKSVAAVNLYGLIDVTMTFLPLIKMARGRVVNTSSVGGRCSMPLATPYCVSKYGVEAFTDGLRRSLFPFGVKALLIEPGSYRTNFISLESAQASFSRAWTQASPEIKAEYGEKYVTSCTESGAYFIEKIVSDRLSEVVDAYVHALLGRFPRARYLVGTTAKIPTFFQTLPEWMSDWIFTKALPLPAALKNKTC